MGLKVLIVIAIHALLVWGFSSSQDQDCETNLGNSTLHLPPTEGEALNSIASMLPNGDEFDASTACKGRQGRIGGITCCCKRSSNLTIASCNVIIIDYGFSGLEGTIPAALSSFTNLKFLDLSYNKIGGAIPESLRDLSFLRYLNLEHNQLNGSIPNSLGKLKNLIYLDMSSNLLNGSIPPSFVALENIKYLDVGYNNLSGPIPPFLGNLTRLVGLTLHTNQFNGTLPPQLGNLKNLSYFWLGSNKLSGSIPHEYAQLTSLDTFDVGGNNISGLIPSFFGNWTRLYSLSLIGNNFEGAIPEEIFQHPEIEYLWISDLRNSSFRFPSSAKLTNITSLVLRNCSIYGAIPPYVGQWQRLQKLDLSFNHLTGEIPNFLNQSLISELSLAGNKLNGTFPIWVTKNADLGVDISYNKLQINESLRPQNVSRMNVFDCCSTDSSAINETNMASLSQLMKSRCLHKKSKRSSLRINCGGGEIYAPDYYYADNDTSNFQAYPEGKWAYSCSGQTSYRSNDNIKAAKCGLIDTNAPLYDSARYCPVSLTYYGFCLHNGNYTVQLFFSEIAYAEMEDYTILYDRVFDIYIQGILRIKDFNMIEKTGTSKQGWTENITQVLVTDSSLKIQLYWAGKGALDGNGPLISAISATAEVGERKLSALQIALIALASAVFTFLLLLLLIWKLYWSGKGELSERYIELLGRTVSVKQIVDATRNFSSKMEIGKGGFGIVYKAELLNQIVAVKKLSGQSVQGVAEFKNEVYTLKSLKHENLVQLLDGYAGKDLLLLIYEHMENNSLSKALFESSLELNWETRFGICLGVAQGLKYLHEDSRIKIVHRDIKASNILLDGNLKPKISDFGMARLYDKNENQNMTIVGGTRGYMAPEYAMRGILTDKADIYSFGVLLLEIVSGKNNADYKPNQESVFLLDTAYVLHKQGRLMDLVDKKLERYNVEQVRTVLGLGMMCTSQSPSLRPTISQVVSVLEGHKTIKQVTDRAPTPPPGADYDRSVDTCFTEISYTSTDGASGSSTAYYVIGEREENNRPPVDEILNKTSI